MPSPALEFALVRILRILIDDQDPRRPVGAGFLVTPQHIITCAHVVNDALGRKKHATDRPEAELLLDFPLLTDRPLLRAKILHWFSVQENSSVAEIEDVAVLQLLPDIPLPAEAQPAPLVLPHEQSFFEQRVRMCGFPVGADNGTYANGLLQGLNAKGWIEIHHQSSELVEGGFSGTAVWAVGENAVCGMTVSVLNRRNAVVAYMIPAALLIRAFPDLDKHSRPANPYQKSGKEIQAEELLGVRAQKKHGFREDIYIHRATVDDELRKYVNQSKHVIITGKPLAGKSRAILNLLNNILPERNVFLIQDTCDKQLPDPEESVEAFIFVFNDIDSLIGEPNFLALLNKIIRCEDCLIIGCCRLSERQSVKSELQERWGYFKEITIPSINNAEKKELKSLTETKNDDLIIDDTVGSFFFPLNPMKVRYENYENQEEKYRIRREILRSYVCINLWRKRNRGVKEIIREYVIKRLENYYGELRNITPFQWDREFKALQENGFIDDLGEKINIEPAYIDKIIARHETEQGIANEIISYYPTTETYTKGSGK